MPNLNGYIKKFGSIPFSEKPFTDADNVALCYIYYMPFEQVVSSSFDDEPVPYDEAAKALFKKRGSKHKPVGLILARNISVQMMAMSRQRRFAEMKMVACTDNFGKQPAVQFNAATFLLPSGEVVVVFRGTDDSLTGWKEDFDILLEDDIPSHDLATKYLEDVAAKFDGELIVCGHSKGGYIAQYSALHASDKVRSRIKYLYNNDGQGLANYDYLDSKAYKELLPKYRHFIPQSSFVGMMLAHDDDYMVVKSIRQVGAMEHDLSTWQFRNGELKPAKGLTTTGKVTDLVFHDVVSNLDSKQSAAFAKALNSIIDGVEAEGLMDVAKNLPATIKEGKAAYNALDAETKNTLKEVSEDVKQSVRSSVKTVISGNYTTVRERLGENATAEAEEE